MVACVQLKSFVHEAAVSPAPKDLLREFVEKKHRYESHDLAAKRFTELAYLVEQSRIFAAEII